MQQPTHDPSHEAPQEAVLAALAAINAIHAQDPAGAEQDYADHIERWVERLLGELSVVGRFAARCQHLERWAIARDQFPTGRVGYNKWRFAIHNHQGQRAEELLVHAGVSADIAAEVRSLVAKKKPRSELGQALEDAACLYFLDQQAEAFMTKHGYDAEKMIGIIQKTWRKMSSGGHQLALQLPMSDSLRQLVEQALAA